MSKADNLPPYCAVGSLNFLEPSGPARLVMGELYFYSSSSSNGSSFSSSNLVANNNNNNNTRADGIQSFIRLCSRT